MTAQFWWWTHSICATNVNSDTTNSKCTFLFLLYNHVGIILIVYNTNKILNITLCTMCIQFNCYAALLNCYQLLFCSNIWTLSYKCNIGKIFFHKKHLKHRFTYTIIKREALPLSLSVFSIPTTNLIPPYTHSDQPKPFTNIGMPTPPHSPSHTNNSSNRYNKHSWVSNKTNGANTTALTVSMEWSNKRAVNL